MSKINDQDRKKIILLFSMIGVFSLLALIFAFYVELAIGLKPCILCLYQRIPYVIILIASLYYIIAKKYHKKIIFFIIISLAAEVSLAFYHVGIERNIFEPTTNCKSDANLDNLPEQELLNQILKTTIPNCNVPTYLIPILSMAEMNLFFSISILILTLRKKNEITWR